MTIDDIAQAVFATLDPHIAKLRPPGYLVVVDWRSESYVGSLQHIDAKYGDIVLLSKTSRPLRREVKDAILASRPETCYVEADDLLDLEDRMHVLRRNGDKLVPLTGEQTDYMKTRNLSVTEQNTGNVKDLREDHLYEGGVELKPNEN